MVEATLEKMWQERIKEFKEKEHKEMPKWDPEHPKNKETYEPGARTYDDNEEDDLDLLDAFIKPPGFDETLAGEIPSQLPIATAKPAAAPAQEEEE